MFTLTVNGFDAEKNRPFNPDIHSHFLFYTGVDISSDGMDIEIRPFLGSYENRQRLAYLAIPLASVRCMRIES